MFRFNTRKKKPKLYNELVILGITAIAVLVAALIGGPYKIRLVSTILTVFFIITTALFFDIFRKQVQYNPYSYNTIFYFGFQCLCNKYEIFVNIVELFHNYIEIRHGNTVFLYINIRTRNSSTYELCFVNLFGGAWSVCRGAD